MPSAPRSSASGRRKGPMESEPRLCSECRYLVGRRSYPESAAEWKCHAKENVISTSVDLVTGSTVYHLRYKTCYDARPSTGADIGCGSAGKWWEKYQQPDYRHKIPGQRTAEDLLKELDE